MPDRVLQRIAEWKRLHPLWYVVVWTNAMVIRHFPSLHEALVSTPTSSDVLRYHIIARYGGVFLDTDLVPLRALPAAITESPFTACKRPGNGSRWSACEIACDAVIGAPRGHGEIQRVAVSALQRTKQRKTPEAPDDGTATGPRVQWAAASLPHSSIKNLRASEVGVRLDGC